MIVGYHSYKKGASVISSNYSNRGASIKSKKSSITATNLRDPNVLNGTIRDENKNKTFDLVFKLREGGKEAEMELKPKEGLIIGTTKEGMTFPKNAILVKIK